MFGKMKDALAKSLEEMEQQGLYKHERIITSPQGTRIVVSGGKEVINFCANNYLGLADREEVVRGAKRALESHGYGLSSVRFICGTQDLHKELERRVSEFLGTEDTLLYAACFDANGGLFEPLLGEEDAIISDELNHASIIDGVRMCRAARYRYHHSDMKDLEGCLKEASGARYRLICTDGVFSMDGDIAKLKEICDLAEEHDALVMVDDSHATGCIGATGRGTAEHRGVQGRVDIITTTFGKALGGASGGCTSGRKEIIEFLRQRSRPYLFSNTLSPAVTGASIAVIDMLTDSNELTLTLKDKASYFRQELKNAGFDILPGETAIIPIMLYEEKTALTMAEELLNEGVYVIGFAYPVVPQGKARIRVQVSAAHSMEDMDYALEAFRRVGKRLGVLA
ncbi:MAG: glycine C-acetyltransferase [Spirochaetales bacterium]|nr:glycine C-acetyltransferase [Spirochaetales bacterium]